MEDFRRHLRHDCEVFAWPAGSSPRADLFSSTYAFMFPLSEPGLVVVDPIAAGLRVRAEAWFEEYASATVEADGPQRAGETATLEIRIPRYGPIVVGQLVGDTGKPVSGLGVTGRIVYANGESDGGRIEAITDSDGRFRLDASGHGSDDPHRERWLELRGASQGLGDGGRARVALPVPFEQGEFDVGRVPYEVAALLVQGRVVDPLGQGVSALVVVCPWRNLASRGGRVDPSRVVGGLCDERGEFEAYGFFGDEPLVAFARKEGQQESPPVGFTAGAREVVLVMRRCGGLAGSLDLESGLSAASFSLFLRRADVERPGDSGFHARHSASRTGAFGWEGVPEGTVDVAVALGIATEHPEVLLVVPGVEVKAGETNRDPRLARIDLRRRVTKLPLEVVGPDGAPVPRGTVTLLATDGSHEPILTAPLRGGRAEVPAVGGWVDVDVRAPGFRRERILGLTAPARVELRGGIPLRVELDPPFEPGPGKLSLAVWLHPYGRDPREPLGPDDQRILLDERGSGRFLGADSGCFDVGLEMTAGGGVGSAPAGYDMGRWEAAGERLTAAFGRPRITIDEGASEQLVRVLLPPAAASILREMIREVGSAAK